MTTAHKGTQRRLARQLREAALQATPEELHDLHLLERLVRLEEVSVFEASRTLTDVIRGQHERRAEAA